MLKGFLENIGICIKDKKAIVQKFVFSSAPKSTLKEPKIPANILYLAITKEQVYNALIAQST